MIINNTHNKFLRNILIILIIFSFTSCKTKFKLFDVNAERMKIGKLMENVENSYFKYQSISVKFSIRYEKDGKRQSLQGMYRIKKDSIIWLSMGPSLGMEIVRGVMEKDSLKFINRFDKTYYSGDYEFLNRMSKLTLNYNTIEHILTNRLVFQENNDQNWRAYLKNNYSYSITGNKYKLNAKNKEPSNKYSDSFIINLKDIAILPEIYKIEEYNWLDENNRKLNIKYIDFKKHKEEYFPDNIIITLNENEEEMLFELKVKQITIDRNFRYPFKIPNKKYTRIY